MPVTKDMIPVIVKTGASARVAEDVTASFKVGDKVRAKNINPAAHTRLPRYVRGKVGTILLDHGVFVTPDTVAHGLGEHPQHVYCVVFSAQELWGGDASGKDTVAIDLWDDYLEKAEA
ncbi:SH3-like domain-containing protein [Rhizobium rhizosphaerae]|uniref:SH3-like domain-containing protein n=1 Tax=Xaviernesmea rhizosphaerae TaxID=1672749 RepID=UPI001AECD44D